jgi:Flp pilus assembly protein TadD
MINANNTEINNKYKEIETFIDEGELEEALEETRLLLAKYDKNSDIWCLEGQVRLALNEFQAAERSFDRACQLAPGHPKPLFYKAKFFIVIQDYEEASRQAELALKYAEHPEDRAFGFYLQAEALFFHSEDLIHQWLEDLAIEDEELTAVGAYTTKRDKIPPMPAEIQALLEKGLALIQRSIDIDDQKADTWRLLGHYQLKLNIPEHTIHSWQKAAELDPYTPDFWHDLGALYTELGEFEQADESFRRLYDIDKEAQRDQGLEYSHSEFADISKHACRDLEEDILEEYDMPLAIYLSMEEFPSAELFELTSPNQPFDPWTPCRLEMSSYPSANNLSIHFTIYQRNVERLLLNDKSPDNLYEIIYDLLRNLLQEASEITEEDNVIQA